jgi:hypothetical protein
MRSLSAFRSWTQIPWTVAFCVVAADDPILLISNNVMLSSLWPVLLDITMPLVTYDGINDTWTDTEPLDQGWASRDLLPVPSLVHWCIGYLDDHNVPDQGLEWP